MSNARRRLIAFAHGLDDPACRFRIRQYLPCFEQAGWDVSLRTNRPARPWESRFRNRLVRTAHRYGGLATRQLRRRWDIHAAAGYDAVFLNRDLLAGRVEYERRLLQRNPRVVFDFDDAIFLGKKADHIQWICRNAAWVTTGNDLLASFARQFTDRVTVVPTVVDTDAYRVREDMRVHSPVRVGWLGSEQSIRETLYPHLGMLARLQRQLAFEFVVVSGVRPDISEPGLHWSFVEWSASTETRTADIFDIGIMPLVDDEFQRGKCGCKLLQYMAAGLPSVASPVGVNSRLIAHGERGFLAASEQEWQQALGALAADPELRGQMGRAGRQFVSAHFSRRQWFPVLLDIVEHVAAGTRPSIASALDACADDPRRHEHGADVLVSQTL